MKFDVILGNPPYNNDLYIDMILALSNMYSQYMSMIIPAKWQGKQGDKNDTFREQIVPYMDRIVYFKDCRDVFNIKEAGGISYYLADKDIHSEKLVKNECSKSRVFLSDWEIHKESPLILSTQTIVNMINKVKHVMPISIDIECKYSKYVRYDEWGNSERKNADDVEIIQSGSVVGYIPRNRLNTLDGLDKYKVIVHMMSNGGGSLGKEGSGYGLSPVLILGKNQIPKGSYTILADFDTGGKALSLKTYVSTKFTRFLYFIGESGTSMQSEFWRNVPAIDNYDTIYEDRPMNGYIPNNNGEYIDNKGIKHCSLYIKYKLTSDEIDVIESVIKDRK